MALFKRSGIPDVNKLKDDDSYQKIMELNFDDMIPFVMSNIRKPGLFSRIYLVLNILTVIALILWLVNGFLEGWLAWITLIKQFIVGVFAGSFLVIPVHELFHGLAYKILGAKKIKFGADLQQLIFYVTADRFPVASRELCFLALLPFAAINAVSLTVAILWVPQLIILLAFFLLAHNIMCIGDFAIVNFTHKEPGKVYSYDEIEQKKSFFYKRVNAL
jgi:hypothetical protein